MQVQNTPAKSHRLRNGILIATGIVILGIIGNAIGKSGATPQPTQNGSQEVVQTQEQVKELQWVTVKSWEGNGGKKTEPFTITGKQWRINWINKDTTGYGGTILQVFARKPGDNGIGDLIVNSQGGQGTSYVYKSGEFYLEVNGANGNWKIVVEELK